MSPQANDLVAELRSWVGWPEKELDRLLTRAADNIARMRDALTAAEKDLATVEREIRGIAPEAKSTALPMIREALAALERVGEKP